MEFVLFVEGDTEKKVLSGFFSRCMKSQFPEGKPVRVEARKFKGWADLHENAAQMARDYFDSPDRREIIAVISLLDLYGPNIYSDRESPSLRWRLGVDHMKKRVDNEKYRHYFAVHEVEAWLLSDPSIFPRKVQETLKPLSKNPENVNSGHPPAEQLSAIYRSKLNRSYDKVTDGTNLFPLLDPKIALAACPYLKLMVDEMVVLAKASQGKKTPTPLLPELGEGVGG